MQTRALMERNDMTDEKKRKKEKRIRALI